LAQAPPQLAELLQQTRTVPIVFVQVPDPVGGGFVASLATPGGNATGFTSFEDSMSSKWLELLKEAQPGVRRVAVLRNPLPATGSAVLMPALQSAAHALGVTLILIDMQGPADVDTAFQTIASQAADGLIVLPDPVATINRTRITELGIRHKLPSVFYYGYFAQSGGLIAYGPDSIDIFSRSAEYVDRILRGARPATLPVQQPTKYELVVNLKTAKAIGLNLPSTLVGRADKVIE
jgi:putative ABC transport system substrate-binding protein